jgi:hypothetical protein
MGKVDGLSGEQVVGHRDVMPGGQQPIDEMTPDET